MSSTKHRTANNNLANYTDKGYGFGKVLFLSDFGAMQDNQRVTDVVVTNGSKTITSASGRFAAGDVGKAIKLSWCDDGNDLKSTITGYTNPETVTIADFPNMPTDNDGVMPVLTNVTTYWGTDDTAAIQAALVAAHALGGAEIIVTGNCVLAGEIVGVVGGNDFRGLVHFVPTDFFGQNPPPGHIKLRGITPIYVLSADPINISYPSMAGAGFHSYTSSNTAGDAIFCTDKSLMPSNGDFSQGYVSFEDLKFFVPANGGNGWIEPGMGAGLSGVNGGKTGTARFKGCLASIDDAIIKSAEPTVRHFGFSTTNENSQHLSSIEFCLAHGFYDGAQIGEHTWVNQFGAFASIHPFALKDGRFPVTAGVILQNWSRHGFTALGNNQGINIQMLGIESRNDTQNGSPAWWRTIEAGGLLYDPSNYIKGGSARYLNGSGLIPTALTGGGHAFDFIVN